MAVSEVVVALGAFLCVARGAAGAAGFIKSPLSQKKLTEDSVELHCEAVGSPIPEIQWWFEGAEPNDTASQLWDGAWQDRVAINATYERHSTSTISIANLTLDDSGTYECRASNDPDRNHLSRSPKVKWIRSQANVIVTERPIITVSKELNEVSNLVMSCNISGAPTEIKGHYWMKGDTEIHADDSSADFTSYTLEKVDHESSGEYDCFFKTSPLSKGTVLVKVAPNVFAPKKSEHGNEKDTGVLICKSSSYPPITNWSWYKMLDWPQPILNGTDGRFFIKSDVNKTELRIMSLDIEKDPGEYRCNGTNEMGEDSAVVSLRVRSRLAALWPFLGIVAEVLVLVTIIFIYEKRRKPDEVPDDDGGTAPLKSNASNHKDQNVRQRNAN
ncbi:basigin isoform X2 [Paroedura picta]|uniref:basigin isoform X2 n=1 Tax=Paroedura picta TaxID=143630 RepID=UPI004056E25D